MKKAFDENIYKIINGDSMKVLDTLEEKSIDSVVTDPPYGLTSITKRFGKENSAPAQFGKDGSFARLSKGFMGKEWDGSGIEYNVDFWEKVYRVLKPGGYLLAFGGSRTFYRIACAIEDAGFEIRDTIMWLYGSGFPKSMNIGKALEAKEKIGNSGTRAKRQIEQSCDTPTKVIKQTNNDAMGEIIETTRKDYVAGTNLAKEWQGWGTCLKPAYEPIIVARKPCEGTIADNIIKYGVGGINIDECRVGNEIIKGGTMPDLDYVGKEQVKNGNGHKLSFGQVENAPRLEREDSIGRFPSNVIHDGSEEVISGMPITKSTYNEEGKHETEIHRENQDILSYGYSNRIDSGFNDEGSASRYFYCAKASKKDRDGGLDYLEARTTGELQGGRKEGSLGSMMPNEDGTTRLNPYAGSGAVKKNIHPTVKPVELMQYLVRLVSPKGATILDPFNGSGSTGKAVAFENREKERDYKYIGIELDKEYCEISKSRIDYALNKYEYDMMQDIKQEEEKTGQLSLFDFEGE